MKTMKHITFEYQMEIQLVENKSYAYDVEDEKIKGRAD